MKRALAPGLLLLAVALLAACATMPPTVTEGDNARFRLRQAELSALDSWQVTGRIAFKIADEGGTGAMTWAQAGRDMAFSFRGPLGAGAFNLDGSPPDLLLQTGNGDVQRLEDPETELRARFGWSAPFASLRYWMLGLPDPDNAAVTAVDEAGLLRKLDQAGWAVSYERYGAGAPMLPRKLTLLRDEVRIRVIIDRWHLDDTTG